MSQRLMLRAGASISTLSSASKTMAIATRAVMKPRHRRANDVSRSSSAASKVEDVAKGSWCNSVPPARLMVGAAVKAAVAAGQGIGAGQVQRADSATHHVLRLGQGV